MAKAVAARMYGDDYQARFFWIHACRLFDDRTKVTEVEIEAENIKSLDDVAVHYRAGVSDCGKTIFGDYYQVKFHVSANGAFTWEGMMNPAFINAKSVSLLARIRNAQVKYAPDGTGCRFIIYSPWAPHPDDVIASLVSNTDGHIKWDVLEEGGDKSAMGKVRTAWRKHLALDSDEKLRTALAPLRLEQGPSFETLGSLLNDKLMLAGLKPVTEGAMVHPYEGLAKKLVQAGITKFKREDIEKCCKNEGLWIGKTMLDPDARRIGIRSFLRFAEHLEDETDDLLCLLDLFEGRHIRRPDDWDTTIYFRVSNFLRQVVKPGSHYLLHLPAHGTIAFLTGWCLDPKSGVDTALVQPGSGGRQVWRAPASVPAAPVMADWQIVSTKVSEGGHDIALAVSVTHDIESDVALYVKKYLPAVSRIIHFRMPTPGPTAIADASNACSLAHRFSSVLKTQRTPEERGARLHLFIAAPNSFVFFMGQQARSFGKISLYEYDFETSAPGAYMPSASLPPSSVGNVPGS